MPYGKFITLEGGEGAGKSTQISLLAAWLREQGQSVVTTREPGGSKGAEEIRELLIHGEAGRWDAETEALMMFAARRDHLVKTVWPALDAGSWVLCDRFADSTFAYQGFGHGRDLAPLRTLYDFTMGDFKPDLTLLLDLPVEAGLARAAARNMGGARFEGLGSAFHEKLRRGFLILAAEEPERFAIIDANQDQEAVSHAIQACVSDRLHADSSGGTDEGETAPK
ncbi:dTMP kinase [Rhodovibrionaceae bacterium A322]